MRRTVCGALRCVLLLCGVELNQHIQDSTFGRVLSSVLKKYLDKGFQRCNTSSAASGALFKSGKGLE